MATVPLLLWAISTGPDPGKAGVPGESTCTEVGCHVGTPLNGGAGSVKVTFPAGLNYVPGVKQHLVVTVADPAATQRFWGFELTARQSTDSKSQAGSFTSTDGFTAVVCASVAGLLNQTQWTFIDFPQNQNCPASRPLAYIEHTANGSQRFKTGSQTFEFDWTPPASAVGNIVIYVAGNAANADGNNTGDHIYTATYTLAPGAAGPAPAISAGGIVSAANFGAFTSVGPGSWMEIYGTNLSTTTRGWAGDDFTGVNAPASLDGVKVTIGGQSAFVDYVSPGQVNAQVPSNTPTGTQQVTVANTGGTSAGYTMTVNSVQPGLLAPPSFTVGGKLYVVAQFADQTYVMPPGAIPGIASRQAKPGETILIYGVGFGPSATASGQVIPAGQVVPALNSLTGSLKVQFAGTDATVQYGGLAPNYVGLYQFNIVVPSVPDSDLVPIVFALNGQNLPQTLFTAVKR